MREKIANLDCLKREGQNDKHCVVLLHGFGADASDLFPLADALDPEENWTFYFPNAPLEVPIGPAWTGRAWFPVSLALLEQGLDFSQIRPPGLDEARATVSDLLFELNPEKTILGGFSQGAMLSTEVALNQPEDVSGLILYSGTLLDQKGWTEQASRLKGKRFLQSHGTRDPVVPYAGGQKLYELLKGAGAEGQFLSFAGVHEIPSQVLHKTREFLIALEG